MRISKNNIRKVFEIATFETHFMFENKFYCQVDGVAIGSPLGPVLANPSMVTVKKLGFQVILTYVHFFYKCYVDICGALRDLVPFAQFKKREKHPWRSVNFGVKCQALACNFTKINTPPWVFFTLFKFFQFLKHTMRLCPFLNTLIHDNIT